MTDDIPQTVRLIVKARYRISPDSELAREARKCLTRASAILRAIQAGEVSGESLFLGRYAIQVTDSEGYTIGVFLSADELASFLKIRSSRAYGLAYARIPERLGRPKAATSNAAKINGKTIQIIPFDPAKGRIAKNQHI